MPNRTDHQAGDSGAGEDEPLPGDRGNQGKERRKVLGIVQSVENAMTYRAANTVNIHSTLHCCSTMRTNRKVTPRLHLSQTLFGKSESKVIEKS